jgi:hypothetical protein
MHAIQHIVRRGRHAGRLLQPHRYADGCFVVSRTRFAVDQVRVADPAELPSWVARGYGVRMSDPSAGRRQGPSLIKASRLAPPR